MSKQIYEHQWYRMSVTDVLSATGSSERGLGTNELNSNYKAYGFIKPLFLPKWLMPYFIYSTIRAGKLLQIQSDELLFGDIVTLNKGDVIPALMRVLRVKDVRIQEKNFTGFSDLAIKNSFAIRSLVPTGQQKNMLFPGSYVVSGQVTGVVVGNQGQYKIRKEPQSKKLDKFGIVTSNKKSKIILGCNAIIFDGLTKTKDIKDSLRLLYINNNITCLYLTSPENVKNIVTEMPELQLLGKGNVSTEPGVYIAANMQHLDIPIKNFIDNHKVLYVGPDAGKDPISLATESAIVAGNDFEQINLLTTQALAVGITAQNLSSILYNKK